VSSSALHPAESRSRFGLHDVTSSELTHQRGGRLAQRRRFELGPEREHFRRGFRPFADSRQRAAEECVEQPIPAVAASRGEAPSITQTARAIAARRLRLRAAPSAIRADGVGAGDRDGEVPRCGSVAAPPSAGALGGRVASVAGAGARGARSRVAVLAFLFGHLAHDQPAFGDGALHLSWRTAFFASWSSLCVRRGAIRVSLGRGGSRVGCSGADALAGWR
jgi:hypothetical protein